MWSKTKNSSSSSSRRKRKSSVLSAKKGGKPVESGNIIRLVTKVRFEKNASSSNEKAMRTKSFLKFDHRFVFAVESPLGKRISPRASLDIFSKRGRFLCS
jgi:hypothetical protein